MCWNWATKAHTSAKCNVDPSFLLPLVDMGSPPAPQGPGTPLVEVLLSDVAAIQHQDIEDVDCTDLPLGLPLQGTSMLSTVQVLASGPLWHAPVRL